MIQQSLDERQYAVLTEPQLKRVVRLIKEELRRGRHPYTLMELLNANDKSGRRFLFDVVGKKVELTPLAGADVPHVVRALANAEKFRAAKERRRFEKSVPSSLSTSPTVMGAAELTEAVALWFKQHVSYDLWQAVGNKALDTVVNNPPKWNYPPSTRTLDDLIAQSRPKLLIPTDVITFSASWLLTWLYALRSVSV
jgi:hypothetical protein